jgi:transcriptional regulator with XRE-family HTH domain
MANVGKTIRRLRTEKHLTQDDLAARLHVTRQTVSNYETGKSNPDVEMLISIAEVFETDVNCLIYGPTVPPNRRRQREKILWMVLLTVAFTVGMNWFDGWSERLMVEHYELFMRYWLIIFIRPLCCALWGLLAAATGREFLDAKLPKIRWHRRIFWALLALAGIYLVLMLPTLVQMLQGHILASRMWKNGGELSVEFSFLPLWDTLAEQMARFAGSHGEIFLILWVLLGTGIGLTGKKRATADRDPIKSE